MQSLLSLTRDSFLEAAAAPRPHTVRKPKLAHADRPNGQALRLDTAREQEEEEERGEGAIRRTEESSV